MALHTSDITTTTSTSYTSVEAGQRVVITRRAFRWPEISLSLILFALLCTGAITLGTYSYFASVQDRLHITNPWYYFFLIATGAMTVVFVLVSVILYYIHMLLPIPIIFCSFVLFVFWLTGLVKSSIELWGPMGSVNDNCVRYVYGDNTWGGATRETLARIQQEGMCNLWKTVFAMEMIACFCCLWLCLMAWQVNNAASIRYER
ncbi:hypothetical protein FPQ18DRAFT_277939 [Pyronema domesticum]|uniref:MARVEL domain-containing protein n=1 Tax=Pyronema omphalodes (strain CBS 100304) TaxID=1076935 RepID=U4LDR2_PYROM|nr:hypothetical protein FPQ18DRAFT_277939 [Pyronema domesticum]CCX29998.1 Similar to hypothetical protein [Tuber melanosporum Mel28]; acc. no. XP_002838505 [Pyronema omphalodes CBS 100304]